MKVRNVLVFPAGTEIGLEIHEALRQCKEVQLFGAGVSTPSHGPFAFGSFHPLPSIHEEGWLIALSALCRELAIDYIFPAHDDVVVALACEQAHIPAVVLTASLETCITTRSKRATYNALQHLIRVPKLFQAPLLASDYPVFVKPDCGQGSQGVTLVRSMDALGAATAPLTAPLICEFLPGDEYTVDCLSDRDRGLLFAGARVRRRARNGISVNTVPVILDEAETIAQKISHVFQMRGAWFFQLKRAADGELALLEVAPRIAGSMSTHRVIGVNFPLLTIFEYERAPIRLLLNRDGIELDRALRNRFRHPILFSTLYIDLDDTLILREKVNVDAINLIFQCVNQGIKCKLLTRHAGGLQTTLQRFRLTGLFDQVIHLSAKDRKSDYITESDAIFVDDSFAERWEVHHRLGIRTFDCSMIELLLQAQPHSLIESNSP
jgi:carbamoyl-phosphate synthase large subunit